MRLSQVRKITRTKTKTNLNKTKNTMGLQDIIFKWEELDTLTINAINEKVKDITNNGTQVIELSETIYVEGFSELKYVVYVNEDMTARLTNDPDTTNFYDFLDTQDLSYDQLYYLAVFIENGLFVVQKK